MGLLSIEVFKEVLEGQRRQKSVEIPSENTGRYLRPNSVKYRT